MNAFLTNYLANIIPVSFEIESKGEVTKSVKMNINSSVYQQQY